MAVSAPTTLLEEDYGTADNPGSSTSFSLSAGESLILGYAGASLGAYPTLTLSGGVGAADIALDNVSPFTGNMAGLHIWFEPGAGSYTIDGLPGFFAQQLQLVTVTGVNSSTPARTPVAGDEGNGDSVSDTGVFNVTSSTDNRVFMCIISDSATISGDQTEIYDSQISTDAAYSMIQHAAGAATVDMGASGLAGQSAWVALDVNAAAAAGGDGFVGPFGGGYRFVRGPSPTISIF